MSRHHELGDLRRTNDRQAQRRQRRADFHARTQRRRNKRRQLDLLIAGIGTGWVQRWTR